MEAIALTNALAEEKERLKSNSRREAFQEGTHLLSARPGSERER